MPLDIVYPAVNFAAQPTLNDVFANADVLRANSIKNRIAEMMLKEKMADDALMEGFGNAMLQANGDGNAVKMAGGPQIPAGTGMPGPANAALAPGGPLASPVGPVATGYGAVLPETVVPGPETPVSAPGSLPGQPQNLLPLGLDRGVAASNPAAYARFVMGRNADTAKQVKERTDFYQALAVEAIRVGDNNALQAVLKKARQDPFVGSMIPDEFNMTTGSRNEVSVTSKLTTEQLGKIAESVKDPDLKVQVANSPPGTYEIKKKAGEVTEVKPVKAENQTLLSLAHDIALHRLAEAGEKREPTPEEEADAYAELRGSNDPITVAIRHVVGAKTGAPLPKWSELKDNQRKEVLTILGAPTMARFNAQMAAQADVYDQDTMEQAYQYMKVTGKPRPEDLRLAIRFPGAMAKLQKYISQRAAQDGWTGADRAFAEVKNRAIQTEYTTTARMKALTLRYEGMLRLNTDVLEQENMKVLRSRFPDFNKVKQAIQKGTGDPDIVAFTQQLSRVAVEWAKISSGSLGVQEPSIEAQKRMNEMLQASNNWEQMQAQIQTIRIDAAHTAASTYERETQQRREFYEIGGMKAPDIGPVKTKRVKIKVGNMWVETEVPLESEYGLTAGGKVKPGNARPSGVKENPTPTKELLPFH